MAKILVVEDDLCVLEMIAAFLSDRGYDVITAYNGNNGISQFVIPPHPDLVITDLNMAKMVRDMDGDDMARHIKSFSPTTPIIMLTARDISRVSRILETIDDYQTKPIDLDVLVDQIESLLINYQTPQGRNPDES